MADVVAIAHPKNTLEVRDQNLDFLSELHRDFVFFGLGQIPGDLISVFALFTSDRSSVGVGANVRPARIRRTAPLALLASVPSWLSPPTNVEIESEGHPAIKEESFSGTSQK